jgi:hypothetical protein
MSNKADEIISSLYANKTFRYNVIKIFNHLGKLNINQRAQLAKDLVLNNIIKSALIIILLDELSEK